MLEPEARTLLLMIYTTAMLSTLQLQADELACMLFECRIGAGCPTLAYRLVAHGKMPAQGGTSRLPPFVFR